MEQIKDFTASRPFRCQLDLADGYYKIRIQPNSVSDSTFTHHMWKFDSLLTQQGACNVPATMIGAMNYLFTNVANQIIYLDDMLNANDTYEEHINSMQQVLQRVMENNLWFNRHISQFMPDKLAILEGYLTELGLQADPDKVNTVTAKN